LGAEIVKLRQLISSIWTACSPKIGPSSILAFGKSAMDRCMKRGEAWEIKYGSLQSSSQGCMQAILIDRRHLDRTCLATRMTLRDLRRTKPSDVEHTSFQKFHPHGLRYRHTWLARIRARNIIHVVTIVWTRCLEPRRPWQMTSPGPCSSTCLDQVIRRSRA
jgi:hypothetical protein